MDKKKWTLARIGAEVLRMDPKVDPDSDTFQAAVVLLCGVVVGPSKAAAFSGYPASVTGPIVERLRTSGIWKGRQVHHSGWFDEDAGGMAFWMDVCVAEGLMQRAPAEA